MMNFTLILYIPEIYKKIRLAFMECGLSLGNIIKTRHYSLSGSNTQI